jgi:hypothetical protein
MAVGAAVPCQHAVGERRLQRSQRTKARYSAVSSQSFDNLRRDQPMVQTDVKMPQARLAVNEVLDVLSPTLSDR